jgi:hypothetical protein
MSFEMPIKIRENTFTGKDGIEKTAKEIKLSDLGVDAYVILNKVYTKPIEKLITKADGTQFKSYKTMVDYNGERVNLTINEKTVEKWNAIGLGGVRVTKTENEGSKGIYYTYLFESVTV